MGTNKGFYTNTHITLLVLVKQAEPYNSVAMKRQKFEINICSLCVCFHFPFAFIMKHSRWILCSMFMFMCVSHWYLFCVLCWCIIPFTRMLTLVLSMQSAIDSRRNWHRRERYTPNENKKKKTKPYAIRNSSHFMYYASKYNRINCGVVRKRVGNSMAARQRQTAIPNKRYSTRKHAIFHKRCALLFSLLFFDSLSSHLNWFCAVVMYVFVRSFFAHVCTLSLSLSLNVQSSRECYTKTEIPCLWHFSKLNICWRTSRHMNILQYRNKKTAMLYRWLGRSFVRSMVLRVVSMSSSESHFSIEQITWDIEINRCQPNQIQPS